FPHAEQAVPAAGSRRGALVGAVVEHGDLDVRPDADDADLRPGPGPGVFLHVGEGLLDDPVGGRVDGGGQGGVPDVAGHLHVQPGAAEGAREFVQAVQAGRGLGRCLGVPGLAEQADGGAQLVQGGAAGLADVGEGLLGLVGPLVHDVGGDPGLDVDQGDVVGDDVVQVAGDAQAFLGDPAAGLLLAGAFGTLGAFPDGLDDGAAAADGVTGAGADAGPGEDREVLLRVPGQRAGGHGGAGQDGHGEQAEAPGGGPVGGGGDGVERDDGAHGDGGAGVAGEGVEDGEGPGDGEDGPRGAAAEGQRGGAEGHQDQPERAGGAQTPGDAVRAVRVDEGAGHHADQDERGQGGVEGEGVGAQPAPGARQGARGRPR